MMIAKNKKERFIQGGNDIIKIIHGQVPGGKNQVYIIKTLFDAG